MVAKGRLLNYVQLRALCFGVHQFGDIVPNRWKLVARYVNENSKNFQNLDKFCVGEKTSTIFNPTEKECRLVYEILEKSYVSVIEYARHERENLFCSSEKDAYKPLVLIPPVRFCCKVRITVRNQPSFAHVYTTGGTIIAAIFHGVCKTCETKYYYSYKETKSADGNSAWFFLPPTDDRAYFQISSKTVFEKRLLKEVSASIEIAADSFEARAKVYNEVNRESDTARLSNLSKDFKRKAETSGLMDAWELNDQRLEESYFYWKLVLFYSEDGTLAETDLYASRCPSGQRRDIEILCEKALKHVRERKQHKWIQHTCEKKGCKEGYVTIDGVEKIRRMKCALPKSKLAVPKAMANIIQCCPKTPVLSGKHNKPSQLCKCNKSTS